MESENTYQALANHLDSFPQGFPKTENQVELSLLAYLFTPEEAEFALHLSQYYEPLDNILVDTAISKSEARAMIKAMGSKGLISVTQSAEGIALKLLPFIVGFYENQVFQMDETFAKLFEDYYRQVQKQLLSYEPQFHRVVPVNETIKSQIEILPEDNVVALLSSKKAYAVLDCVCRKQKLLIGEGCEHPLRMCLAMSDFPGAFDNAPGMDALDLAGALAVLDEAAAAGLVHTVSN